MDPIPSSKSAANVPGPCTWYRCLRDECGRKCARLPRFQLRLPPRGESPLRVMALGVAEMTLDLDRFAVARPQHAPVAAEHLLEVGGGDERVGLLRVHAFGGELELEARLAVAQVPRLHEVAAVELECNGPEPVQLAVDPEAVLR